MAAPIASAQPLHLTIQQDLNANSVSVTYGSKRYTVRVLQLNGPTRHEVTGLRDWTGVTRIVLDYLQQELNSPFDFNRMKRADIAFYGNVALNATTHFPNPQPAVITNVRWSQEIAEQPMEDVPLPSPQKAAVVDKLTRLGTELATYRPFIAAPQPPSPPPPPPVAVTTLIHDAGGGGDCGPNSIAHQLSLMPGQAPKTPQQLRNEVFQYFNTDQAIRDPLLRNYVIQSLHEEMADNVRHNQRAFPDAATITGDLVARDLQDYGNAPSEDLLRRILTYRKERLNTDGVWVDKDFFHVLGQLGTPIGIIRRNGNQHIIEERFPSNQPIDRDRTAWIYYNGTRTNGGYHFQSFYRDRANFIQWLDRLILEDRNRAVDHLCEQIRERRIRLYGDPQTKANAIIAIQRNVTDFFNKHPEIFTRALNQMKEVEPALTFDPANFAQNDAFYEELLNNKYANIFTAQNLMNL